MPLFVIPGDRAQPTLTLERKLQAQVTLEPNQTAAVQAFAVTAEGYDCGRVAARARTDIGTIRLTLLADDAVGLYEVWDGPQAGTADGVVVPQVLDPQAPSRRYLAIVEKVDAPAGASVHIEMTVTAECVLGGRFLGFSSPPTIPPDSYLSVDAEGPFAARAVSVVRSSYRETVDVTEDASERTMRVLSSGAALPPAAGGLGRTVIAMSIEYFNLPLARDEISVFAHPGSLPDIGIWGLYRPEPPEEVDLRRTGFDLTYLCDNSASECRQDLVVEWHLAPYGIRPANTLARITFSFEVMVFLLDSPTVPDGTSVSLQPLAGPAPG
jgi:hypothetical protein